MPSKGVKKNVCLERRSTDSSTLHDLTFGKEKARDVEVAGWGGAVEGEEISDIGSFHPVPRLAF